MQQQTVANGYQCKSSTVVRGVGVIVGGDGDDVISVVAGVGFVHCVCFVAVVGFVIGVADFAGFAGVGETGIVDSGVFFVGLDAVGFVGVGVSLVGFGVSGVGVGGVGVGGVGDVIVVRV